MGRRYSRVSICLEEMVRVWKLELGLYVDRGGERKFGFGNGGLTRVLREYND